MPSVIVWDLETVPDLNGYARAKGLTGLSDDQVREDLGEKFPKHIYHSIVCIGAVVAHFSEGWVVDAVGAPHLGERSEKDLISGFVTNYQAFSRFRPLPKSPVSPQCH